MQDRIGDAETGSNIPSAAHSPLPELAVRTTVGDSLHRLGGAYQNRELQKLIELSLGKDQTAKDFITGPRRLYVVTTAGILSFSYTGEPSGPIKWAKDRLSLSWSDVQEISADPGYPERIRVELRGNQPTRTMAVAAERRDSVVSVLRRARDDAAERPRRRDGRQALVDCPDCGHALSRRASTCPQCGAPIRASRPFPAGDVAVEQRAAKTIDDSGAIASRTRKSPFACPMCNDDARCRKVSAVYHSQTSTHTRHSSGSIFTPFIAVLFGQRFRLHRTSSFSRGTERSNLARLLAPPRSRATHRSTSWSMRLLMMLTGIAATVTLTVALHDTVPLFVDTGIFWIGLPGLPLLLIMFVPRLVGAPTKRQYTKRLQRWESAYYCSKHDVVFMPGTDVSVAAKNFQFFLRK